MDREVGDGLRARRAQRLDAGTDPLQVRTAVRARMALGGHLEDLRVAPLRVALLDPSHAARLGVQLRGVVGHDLVVDPAPPLVLDDRDVEPERVRVHGHLLTRQSRARRASSELRGPLRQVRLLHLVGPELAEVRLRGLRRRRRGGVSFAALQESSQRAIADRGREARIQDPRVGQLCGERICRRTRRHAQERPAPPGGTQSAPRRCARTSTTRSSSRGIAESTPAVRDSPTRLCVFPRSEAGTQTLEKRATPRGRPWRRQRAKSRAPSSCRRRICRRSRRGICRNPCR